MNAKNTKIMLKLALKANDTVLLDGKHGIGKTSVIKQFAKENLMYLEPLILSLKDPSDLLGMPNINSTGITKRTEFAEPDWFQRIVDKAWPEHFYFSDLEFHDLEFKNYIDNLDYNYSEKIHRKQLNEWYCEFYNLNSKELELTKEQYNISCKKSQNSVLMLDELNRAFLDTRQCSLELVLEKRLHSHILPFVNGQRTFICAAINPPDLYQTEELDVALLDRFMYIEMTIDSTDWLEYTKGVVIDVIRDYISENPEHLHYMDPNSPKNNATPRSWCKLSDYLVQDTEDLKNRIILENTIFGKIGKTVGFDFLTYYLNYKTALSVDDIVKTVFENKSKSIKDIAEELKLLLKDTESIRKHSLTNRLIELAEEELESKKYNIISLSVLCLLTSLNIEISLGFCKKLKAINSKLYYHLVQADSEINNKEFFIGLTKYNKE